MVGKATLAACKWILERYEGITNFYLESNLATDKKASQINSMHTRGKRVTAEAANAITAMFIATGQDVANVAVSSAGVLYSELTSDGFYISLTIPSLIVATYGGGTELPTERECLEMLGCYGKGKVRRLAEIIAGVALAGEISLGAEISSSDWVSGHAKYGRNR